MHIRQVTQQSDVRFGKEDLRQPWRSRHTRWRSQHGSQATTAESAVPIARRSIESSRLQNNQASLVSEPYEAAEVAKVFDRMV